MDAVTTAILAIAILLTLDVAAVQLRNPNGPTTGRRRR
jgi:hypothetical protein